MAEWPLPNRTRMDEIFESVKNWGRWGDEDEAGALNLITDEVRRAGAACVRHGRAVSCSRNIPVDPAPDNPHPALHMMVAGGDDCLVHGLGLESTSDFVGIAFHGMASTHLDAFCHVHRNGQMYNGYAGTLVKSTGAKKNSVMCGKDGIVSRGVLIDVPRALGVPWLEPGQVIDPDQLDRALEGQGGARRASGGVRAVESDGSGNAGPAPGMCSVAACARHRRAGERRRVGSHPVASDRGVEHADSRVHPRRDGRASARQPGSVGLDGGL
jgi:hypothetical protein